MVKCVLMLIVSVVLIGCDEVVLHDLSQLQANRVNLLLSANGIKSTKIRKGNGWDVAVPPKDMVRSLSLLNANRVLTRSIDKESIPTSGLLSTKEDRRWQLTRRISVQLESTLEAIPKVLEARVHISPQGEDISMGMLSIPKREASKSQHGTVSVLLLVEEDEVVPSDAVRHLVSGAVGCSIEEVVVVTMTSRRAR